ncbi:32902_t:CDS:2 [Racocetra persica]|uniref:32902_t:CDS:1 n=1 Tax=Racocetra persica TaxID=160502 RepID=A0ACA9P5P2_9GLOM|nr:32902_t:CDS:2 [Racocetra persica]
MEAATLNKLTLIQPQHNLILYNSEISPQVKKDRREYFNMYNKRPEIKEKRKLARLAREGEKMKQERETKAKYYQAENIQVLITLKDEGVYDMVNIMKLAQAGKKPELRIITLTKWKDWKEKAMEQKQIRSEVEVEREKIIDDYEAEQKKNVKADCYNCGEYKKAMEKKLNKKVVSNMEIERVKKAENKLKELYYEYDKAAEESDGDLD